MTAGNGEWGAGCARRWGTAFGVFLKEGRAGAVVCMIQKLPRENHGFIFAQAISGSHALTHCKTFGSTTFFNASITGITLLCAQCNSWCHLCALAWAGCDSIRVYVHADLNCRTHCLQAPHAPLPACIGDSPLPPSVSEVAMCCQILSNVLFLCWTILARQIQTKHRLCSCARVAALTRQLCATMRVQTPLNCQQLKIDSWWT